MACKHYCDWCGEEIRDDTYVNIWHRGLLNFNGEQDVCYKCWKKVKRCVKRGS